MTCKTGAHSDKPFNLDWTRLDCPVNSTHSTGTIDCYCLDKYYMDGTNCLPCPEYCDKCTSSTSCSVQAKNRLSSGNFVLISYKKIFYQEFVMFTFLMMDIYVYLIVFKFLTDKILFRLCL